MERPWDGRDDGKMPGEESEDKTCLFFAIHVLCCLRTVAGLWLCDL